MNWETYIAFGDSITFGARTYMGYPEYVAHLLENETQKKWNVINHSVNGYTVIDLVRSVDTQFQNLRSHAPSVCTLMIGVNDVKMNTDLVDFKIIFNLLLTKLKLIMRTPNIKVFEIPLFPNGVMYPYTIQMNELIPAYNNIIKTVVQQHNIKHYTLKYNADELFDGVHLNKKGCKALAEYTSKLILQDRGL